MLRSRHGQGDPHICEVILDQDNYDNTFRIAVRSRAFNFHLGFRLHCRWGDPRPMADFMDRLIGDQLRHWANMRLHDITGMAAALTPFWEREIHIAMEQMELRLRDRDMFHRRYEYVEAPRYAGYRAASTREDAAAKSKARKLLIDQLDKQQLADFNQRQEFNVKARDGKVYRITSARSFNVFAPDGTKYCGQLVNTPIEDQMLAQKLLLEHEPEKFFRNANSTGGPVDARLNEITFDMEQILRRPPWV